MSKVSILHISWFFQIAPNKRSCHFTTHVASAPPRFARLPPVGVGLAPTKQTFLLPQTQWHPTFCPKNSRSPCGIPVPRAPLTRQNRHGNPLAGLSGSQRWARPVQRPTRPPADSCYQTVEQSIRCAVALQGDPPDPITDRRAHLHHGTLFISCGSATLFNCAENGMTLYLFRPVPSFLSGWIPPGHPSLIDEDKTALPPSIA